MKIAIDPGHGGSETGAVHRRGHFIAEKDLTMSISSGVVALLRDKGESGFLTRTYDRLVRLDERVQMANNLGADYFVSVHLNSFPRNIPDRNAGTSVFHYPGSSQGERLAHHIMNFFETRSPLPAMRGVRESDDEPDEDAQPYLYVLENTTMPACLVEVCFLSEKSDREWITTTEGLYTAAACIADGIFRTAVRDIRHAHDV